MRQITITEDGTVRLTLPRGKSYKRFRVLGKIIGSDFVTDRSEDCIMRAFGGSVGINRELLVYHDFKTITVRFPSGRVLRTLRTTALDYGHTLHFKDNLLDVQLYLALEDFSKPPKEKVPYNNVQARSAFIQGNLFTGETQ
jgi:hypothetical protein